jgi:hypothetical protein
VAGGRIRLSKLVEQQLPGQLKVFKWKPPEELQRVGQFHRWFLTFKEQNIRRHIQSFRQSSQHEHGNISVTAFDLREVTFGNARVPSKLFSRHAAARSRLPDTFAKRP